MPAICHILGDAINADPDVRDSYLTAYDPDAGDGRGFVGLTKKREEAKVFASAVEILELWKIVSKVRPVRSAQVADFSTPHNSLIR